uniref:Uncharacterized protein n=1 Tax=Ditylenchus dipsaci TaxID=166011 RepID=A0A915CQ38_9BILA
MPVAFNGMVAHKLCGSGQEDSVVFEERRTRLTILQRRQKRVCSVSTCRPASTDPTPHSWQKKTEREEDKLSKRRRSESENSNSESLALSSPPRSRAQRLYYCIQPSS